MPNRTKSELPYPLPSSQQLRTEDKFHHIDPGFVNRRLCISTLPLDIREYFLNNVQEGSDHWAQLRNDHVLVTFLLDCCESSNAPSLLEVVTHSQPGYTRFLFRSTERLAPCPEVYEAQRVSHEVELDIDVGKPVVIAYHYKPHLEHHHQNDSRTWLSPGSHMLYCRLCVHLPRQVRNRAASDRSSIPQRSPHFCHMNPMW